MKTILALFFCISTIAFAQEDYISFKLQFDIPEQQHRFSPNDSTPVTVVIKNNSPCPYKFFETWNTWGYFTVGFEIYTKDSVYSIRHQESIWFRNFASLVEIAPGDSLNLSFNLRDSAYVDDIWEDAWVGLPKELPNSAQIRFRYELQKEDAKTMATVEYRSKDYVDLLDNVESEIFSVEHPHDFQWDRAKTFIDENLLLGVFYSDFIPIVYN